MGLHVAAVDVDDRKLDLVHQLGDSRRGPAPGLFPSADYQHGARWHYALRIERRNQARPPGGIALRRRRAALHAPESLLRKCR